MRGLRIVRRHLIGLRRHRACGLESRQGRALWNGRRSIGRCHRTQGRRLYLGRLRSSCGHRAILRRHAIGYSHHLLRNLRIARTQSDCGSRQICAQTRTCRTLRRIPNLKGSCDRFRRTRCGPRSAIGLALSARLCHHHRRLVELRCDRLRFGAEVAAPLQLAFGFADDTQHRHHVTFGHRLAVVETLRVFATN